MSKDGRNARKAVLVSGLVAALLGPLLLATLGEHLTRQRALARLAALRPATGDCPRELPLARGSPAKGGPLLAGWQNIGGCGAGASTGNAAGIKWIGRSVTGGLFGVQCQMTYTRLAPDAERPEHHAFANTLITHPAGDRWILGVNVPLVLKYMRDPFETGVDLSNSGIGDIGVQLTRKLGPIGATLLTFSAGLPTGDYKGRYKMRILNQSQQRGFGKPTAAVTLDHSSDKLWGLTVVGATAAWRGGENEINNYRAPTGSLYGYLGYYLGPLVPALGLSVTGSTGHDRDQTVEQITGLYSAAANLSLEWSSDYLAVLLGASFPYQYDGIYENTEGQPRNPWGWGPWMVGLGVSVSPF